MKHTKEVKIGAFVLSVLVISFFVINYLRGKDIFNREMEICSVYENVEGLVASAPVYIKGYKAGKVVEVDYQPESDDFKVICSVLKDFRIPEDSRMTIYAVDIMGGKGIRLDLGTSSVLVEDGDMLAPSYEAGLMDGLAAGIAPLMEKVGNTLDSLNVTVAGVNKMLGEANQAHITRTLAHLETTMADVKGIARTINGKSSELEALVSNLSTLSAKLGTIADKADDVMGGVSSVVTTLDESDLAGVITSLKALLENINDPDGTVGKLLVDGSVYDSVDELLNDIDTLVKKIEENPKKYLKISVF